MSTKSALADMERIIRELRALDDMKVTVGIHGEAGSDVVAYATIHEFGGVITPQNVKYLTIPLTAKAKKYGAREYPQKLTFIHNKKTGKKCLAIVTQPKKSSGKRVKGRRAAKKATIEPIYALRDSVTIPERSYMRASFDMGKAKLQVWAKEAVSGILQDGVSAAQALETLGDQAQQLPREYIDKGHVRPSKGPLQSELSTQFTTLFDQGRLVGSITHKVSEDHV
jgi:hypothetical protein